ncbi:NACHT domain- and WD repeat-containing protein 1-like [Lytechinus pictus]|uniref:NACHT domain- and WD repeat-containing protein 1-like n=1 Tax=Lytechinus pictus TaxID=7653 RepID=UPI0030B9AFC7
MDSKLNCDPLGFRDKMESKQDCDPVGFRDLVLGETESLPDQESNTVRIFLSSTFTDMKEERNKLIREVFPELGRYCHEKMLEFEVVDMRWGVRDSATADHLTSFLCLNEIDRCKRMSQGPYFVGILGDKYGYRPLNATISSGMFEKLMDTVSKDDSISAEDVDLIRKWYVEDTNAIPPVYVLQPITVHLPDYYDSSDSQKQSETRQKWWVVFDKMRKVFDLAATLARQEGVFTEEEMHELVMSVTEEEIRHGLKDNTNVEDTCIFFTRDFKDMEPSYKQKDALSKFTDIQTDDDNQTLEFVEQSQTLLTRLKKEYIPGVVPSQALHTFTVPWCDKGIDPIGCPGHAEYLEQMCEIFEHRMKAMIDKKWEAQRSKVVNPVKSQLQRELLHHAFFCKTKCSAFQGREDILSSIRSYLSSNMSKPLVVHGISGSGKTSVMAMVARHSREWIEGCVTVLRFLGTSANSSTIHATLQSMCKQICYAYGAPPLLSNHSRDFSELVQLFNKLIEMLPTKDKPLLLLFDSIDQLSSNNNAHKMNWLLKTLPEHVHVVVSMLPHEHNILDNIKKTLTDPRCYICMEVVGEENGIAIMNGWLKERKRRLNDQQVKVVTDAFSKSPQPLFLKLLFEEFVTWPSYKSVEDVKLPTTVVDAINVMFQDLEDRHGLIFVAHALGYLTAGKSGLTEAEIEDVLSCDDKVLNDVYQYWDPPVEGVVRIPPSVWKRLHQDIGEFITERQAGGKTVIAWYHRQFIETAERRYLGDPQSKMDRHKVLADMFLGEYSRGKIRPIRLERRKKDFPNADRLVSPQPLMFGENVFNLRKLHELPFHLMQCEMVNGIPEGMVQHIMYNFEWILTKIRAFSFLELVNDFSTFDEESGILLEALYLSGSNLKEDPFCLAGQLLGRMYDLMDKYPNIKKLLEGAKSWVRTTQHPLIIPRGACLIPPGGQLKTSLAGHPSRVEAIACTGKGDVIVTACKDANDYPMANVWDEENAELIHTLQIRAGSKASGALSLTISRDDRFVIFGCQLLGMFELTSGECMWKLETGDNHAVSSLQINETGSLAIGGSDKGSNVYIWDLNNGQLLTKLEHPKTANFSFFESDDEVLTGCQDGFFRHWSITSKECLHSFQAHKNNDMKVVAHARSVQTLASGDSNGSIKLSRYACKPSGPDMVLEGHRKAVTCLLVLSDDLLASGSADFTVRVWNMTEGSALLKCQGHDGMVTCLWHWPADPKETGSKSILVSCSKDDFLKVWDLAPKDDKCPLITTLEGHSSWISDVTGTKMRVLYSASNDKSAKMWVYTKETMIKRERHSGHAVVVKFTPDDSTVITSGQEGSVKFSSFYDCHVTRREAGFTSKLIFSRDGKNLIGGFKEEGRLRVWKLDQSTEEGGDVFDLEGHEKGILWLAVGQDNEVVSASQDKMIKVWDLDTKSCRLTLKEHEAPVGHVKTVTREKDSFIISTDAKGVLKFWKYDTGECLLSAKEHNASIRCLAVSSDGRYAVTGANDKQMILWSLSPNSFGQVVKRMAVHVSEVICCAFTHDSSKIVWGTHAGVEQLHVWDFLADDDQLLVGHNHAIMDMCISSDDQYLVTASRDCTLKAWHLPTMEMLASFDCKSQIKNIDLVYGSEDRYRLAAENKSGTVLILDMLLEKADRSDISFDHHTQLNETHHILTSSDQNNGKHQSSHTNQQDSGSDSASSKKSSSNSGGKKSRSAICMLY